MFHTACERKEKIMKFVRWQVVAFDKIVPGVPDRDREPIFEKKTETTYLSCDNIILFVCFRTKMIELA